MMPSRPRTPTSPLYSPLTPPTQLDNEEELQLSAMIEDEAGYADYIEGLQQSDSDMATKFDEQAREVPSDDSFNQSQLTGSDRVAEFEESTARTRQAAREKAPNTNTERPARDDSKDALSGHEGHNDPPERRDEAQDGGEDAFPRTPEQQASPLRVQASWVSDAVSACQANKKNPLNKGNVLVVLDLKDPGTACLVDVGHLDTSGGLGQLQRDATALSAGCPSESGLRCLLVLSSFSSVPELVSVALDVPIESVQTDNIHPSPVGTAKTRAARVKEESTQNSTSGAPETDWVKAYDSFFRIITGKRAHGLHRTDFAVALPQVEGIVDIAQKYVAIDAVQNAFTCMLVGYVEHHTLYSTIAKEPVRCVKIGIALKCRLVYDEAFKHLVGSNANFRTGQPFDGLSPDVQARVQARSHELYDERMHAMMRLMTITLPAEKKKKSKSAAVDYPTEVVNQHEQPKGWCMVNTFRDWAGDHIDCLNSDASDNNVRPSYLCTHDRGCDTAAGFFRTIMIGGDSYLPAEKVFHDWQQAAISFDDGKKDLEETVKKALTALKSTASDYVKDLVGSELQLRDRGALDYLTCVKVGAEDVPWGSEDDGESDEEMDED